MAAPSEKYYRCVDNAGRGDVTSLSPEPFRAPSTHVLGESLLPPAPIPHTILPSQQLNKTLIILSPHTRLHYPRCQQTVATTHTLLRRGLLADQLSFSLACRDRRRPLQCSLSHRRPLHFHFHFPSVHSPLSPSRPFAQRRVPLTAPLCVSLQAPAQRPLTLGVCPCHK